MGESLGCLDSSAFHPWVATFLGAFRFWATMAAINQFPLLSAVLTRLIPPSLRRKQRKHRGFSEERAAERMARGVDVPRQDFLTSVIEHNDAKTGLTQDEIAANAGGLVMAGSETTGTLLAGVTYFLLRHPDKLQNLTREIRDHFDTEQQINNDSLLELDYLQACLTEALRIYPPVPTGLVRVVPPFGETSINGQYVPAGVRFVLCFYHLQKLQRLFAFYRLTINISQTVVSMSPLGMCRSPELFRDPSSFVPERWLGDPRYETDNRAASQPFSLGPRNCIGKRSVTRPRCNLILKTHKLLQTSPSTIAPGIGTAVVEI